MAANQKVTTTYTAETTTSSSAEAAKEKSSGIIGNIKEGVKNVAHAIGIGSSHHHDASCNKATCSTYESATAHYTETTEHERNAPLLREKAESMLKKNDKDFAEAEHAQARMLAEHANVKTAQALTHQERGQELLAEAKSDESSSIMGGIKKVLDSFAAHRYETPAAAGAELIQAGAELIEAGPKLQREAAAHSREAPYNDEGEVRHTTAVSSAGQEAATHEGCEIRKRKRE